jgi:hypothetical protein
VTAHDQIARLAITVDEVKPPVRRRVEVPLSIHLDRLHRVFQIVMGWKDYHLYEFRIGRDLAYGVPNPDWDFPGSSPALGEQDDPGQPARANPQQDLQSTTFATVGGIR